MLFVLRVSEMAAAEEDHHVRAMETMARRMNFLRTTLEGQVDDMCKLLFKEVLENDSIPKHKLESTFKALTDIYWSLKFHLAFHVGGERAKKHAELKNLGTHLGLKEELDEYPDMERATDPGSRLLEVVSICFSPSYQERLNFTPIISANFSSSFMLVCNTNSSTRVLCLVENLVSILITRNRNKVIGFSYFKDSANYSVFSELLIL